VPERRGGSRGGARRAAGAPGPGPDVPRGAQTAGGLARLLPDLDRPGAFLLTVDGTAQSYVDPADPGHLEFEYVRRLAHLADTAFPPGAALRALHLGGGALTLPRYLAHTRPGSSQLVVEIDGQLTDLVRAALPWDRRWRIRVRAADARAALAGMRPGGFDLVVGDVFAGARTPAHLTSVEFVRLAAAALEGAGVYAVNVADGGPLAFARGQAAAVRAVFPHVCLIAEPAVLRARRFGNLVLAGCRAPLPLAQLARRAAGDPFAARLLGGADLEAWLGGARPVHDADAVDSPAPPPGAFEV
jgi:spermidine synthase